MDQTKQSELHDAQIQDQFTRQADPFAERHAHRYEDLLEAMADCANVSANDAVLDVACGPGIVSCYFAHRAHHVTGLDIVPAMLERARRMQVELGLSNITWKLGPSKELPFAADSFDCVVTRLSFHHFLDPATALCEMKRVTKPGGSVLVCDIAPLPEVQERFNCWEILLDPSHTRALTEAEFEDLGVRTGLEQLRKRQYGLEMDLEQVLSSSFPEPGDADRIRALFEEEIHTGTDRLGVSAHHQEGRIFITYPVLVLAWRNPKL